MEKRIEDLSKTTGGNALTGLALSTMVIGAIGLFTGDGFGKIWAFVAAFGIFVCGCYGLIPAIVGCGLTTWIGWKAWSSASLFWQIVLIAMAVIAIISGHFYYTAQKKSEKDLVKLKDDLEKQKQAEEADLKKRMSAYEKERRRIKAECQAATEKMNKDFKDELQALRVQIAEAETRIVTNPVLDSSDKKPEVVEFVISQIQRKRATSLADALLQYDGMVRQQDKDRLERETRQLQWEMDRMWRDQQIRQEADDRFNQAMHNMRVEKEQRRQTKLLEELKDSLDN